MMRSKTTLSNHDPNVSVGSDLNQKIVKPWRPTAPRDRGLEDSFHMPMVRKDQSPIDFIKTKGFDMQRANRNL